jgi:hypothetical protein
MVSLTTRFRLWILKQEWTIKAAAAVVVVDLVVEEAVDLVVVVVDTEEVVGDMTAEDLMVAGDLAAVLLPVEPRPLPPLVAVVVGTAVHAKILMNKQFDLPP